MSQLEEFFSAVPRLCGAENAEELGKRNREIFRKELSGEGYQMEDKLQTGRLDPFFDFECPRQDIKEHCRKLARLKEISHYIPKHGITQLIPEQKVLEPELRMAEDNYQEVKALMPVDYAIQSIWF